MPSIAARARCGGRFIPLPENTTAGAANTWSTITIDESNGLVFLPTSSPSPDYYGGLRPGDNRHANSVVALRAATGEIVWSFQTVHHDLWDYDVASPPLLYPGKEGGGVAVGSKTGHLFLFERLTGRPLFPVRERPVPASDVIGEVAAATQPFPDRPATLAPQQITEADIWGATPQERDACLAIFRSLRHEGAFTPPSVRRQPRCARKRRRLAVGRDGLGSHHADDHRTRQPYPGDCASRPECGLRANEKSQPRPRGHGATWYAVRHVATVLPVSVGRSLRGTALGRARRRSRRHGRDCVADDAGRPELGIQAHVCTDRLGPSISVARSPPPPDSSSSARRSIHMSERSRRKMVARCGRPSCLRARGPHRSCSRPRGVARYRDRGRWLRFAVIEARHDARGLCTESVRLSSGPRQIQQHDIRVFLHAFDAPLHAHPERCRSRESRSRA